MAKYIVPVTRIVTTSVDIEVEAPSKKQAAEIAQLEAEGATFDLDTELVDYDLGDVTLIPKKK